MRVLYNCIFVLFLLPASPTFAQCDTVDLAQGRPASASSVQDGNTAAFDPSYAFDGDSINSRWSSVHGIDPQYIYVDLGVPHSLCSVKIFWEAAYATDYFIEGTNDTTAGWTVLQPITGNTTLINTIPVTGSYRFIRMRGTARATGFGYSIIEMQVFGFPPACSPANIALGKTATATSSESGAFPVSAVTDGDLVTRWASDFNDANSIQVDLGAIYPLCRATFHWFNDTYPGSFAIDLSNDGLGFTQDTLIIGNTSAYNVIDLNGSAQFVRMRGITRHNTSVGYSLQEFLLTTANTLPVKFTAFTATADKDQRVRINWTTAMESNNSYFNVERGTDGSRYTPIGRVAGAGNSVVPLDYIWIDSLPPTGKNYYRLKQVDLDGRSEYSPVSTVWIGASSGARLSFYPNPVKETVFIVNPLRVLIREIHIYNTSGVEVKRFSPLVNESTFALSIGELSGGLYTLKVLTDKGTEALKMLK